MTTKNQSEGSQDIRDKNDSPAENKGMLVISRIFDAPRELVFRAWTDPQHLVRWYAPQGCTIRFSQLDLHQGGTFLSCVRTPQAHDCWCKGIYHEIVVPERLVFSMAVANEKGELIGPDEAGMDPHWPRETRVTVTFKDKQGKTELILHQTVSEALAKRTGAHPGWISMLDRLAEELAQVKSATFR